MPTIAFGSSLAEKTYHWIAKESSAAFTGAIECDETMFGGYRAGKRGWGAAGKVIVLGILQRNGVVIIFPIKGRRRAELERLIVTHTLPGSLLTGSKASGATPNIGSICIAECCKSFPSLFR